MKKAKLNIAAPAHITDKIPYLCCFEELGIINISGEKYSRTYEICQPDDSSMELFNQNIVHAVFKDILVGLKDFEFQFTIRNAVTSLNEYFDSIKLPEDKEENVNKLIRAYNDVLIDNACIGHNNFKMKIYLTVTTTADHIEDAIDKFSDIDEFICEQFNRLYGYEAIALSIEERLESLYDIYHPDEASLEFGNIVDYDGNGFSLDSMYRMNLTTKDVIAPTIYDVSDENRNYMRVGNKYVRMLFINSMPINVTDSILSDLISVSSNSVLSVSYSPIDSKFGFEAAARKVKSNTEIKKVPIRDTIKDKKEKKTETRLTFKEESEEQYFNKAALDVLTKCNAKDEPLELTTFVIGLFADDLDELERDSKLLILSANKYNCQLKTLDFQQNEGFQTALPLGNVKVNTARTFNLDRLSHIVPINVHSLFEKEPTLIGLNGINDNFVFVDRHNYPLGFITGLKGSGKTFSLKREMGNTLMTTNDTIVCLTSKPDEYISFATNFDGSFTDAVHTDLFSCVENYGLSNAGEALKAQFLEAYISIKNSLHKKRCLNEEMESDTLAVNKEVASIIKASSLEEALTIAREDPEAYPFFINAMVNHKTSSFYLEYLTERLNIVSFSSAEELLMEIDYLWNMAIVMKKASRNMWIYVDGIDELIYSTAASTYLSSIMTLCEKLKVPFTVVVNESAKIVSNSTAVIELDYLLEKVNYVKLFSQGPIERKRFVEQLHIPQSLVPYIIDKEKGEGIVITPSMNVSFIDSFEDPSVNEFYKCFT